MKHSLQRVIQAAAIVLTFALLTMPAFTLSNETAAEVGGAASVAEAQPTAAAEETAAPEATAANSTAANSTAASSTAASSTAADAEENNMIVMAAAPLLLSSTQGTEFGQYITGSSIEKSSDGASWSTIASGGSVTDGDKVRVALNYTLPQGVVTSTSRTIYYQLPTGIRPDQAESGTVYDSGNQAVGSYTLDANGKIVITFNEDFANKNQSFTGTFRFSGSASLDSSSTSQQEASFGASGGSIIIVPKAKQTDLTVGKSGKLGSDGKTVSYKITASSVNGTPDTVTLADYFRSDSTASGSYDRNSFVLQKKSADGTLSAVSGYTPQITSGTGGESFTLGGLPALAAGESYVLSYSAQVTATSSSSTGASAIGNTVKATSGTKSAQDTSTVQVSSAVMQKSGEYLASDGLIHWKISVHGTGRALGGSVLSDTLPTGLEISGSVTLHNITAGTTQTVTLPYTFPAGASGEYTVEYCTTAPAESTSVTNHAELNGTPGKYAADGTATVTHTAGDVAKGCGGITGTSGDASVCSWNIQVWPKDSTLAANEHWICTDTIQNGIDATGKDLGAQSHYAVAADLTAALAQNTLYGLDGTQESLSPSDYTITCYDVNGAVVAAADTTTPVKSFKIDICPKTALKGQQLIFHYTTLLTAKDATADANATFANALTSTYGNKNTEYIYTPQTPQDPQAPLIKQSGKNQDGSVKYQSGASQMDYNAIGNKLYYRLLLHTDASTTGDLTVTDVLPAGTSYVADSLAGFFYDSESYVHPQLDNGDYSFSGAQKPTVTVAKNAQGEDVLTVTIADGYNQKCGTNYRTLALTYQASIAQDAKWTDAKTEDVVYENNAAWNGNPASQQTTVHREIKSLEKTGTQLMDVDGKPRNAAEYQIVINSAGLDLAIGADTITLKDTLSLASGTFAELLPSTVHLYRYSGAAADKRGEEIDKALYSYRYDAVTNTLSFILPDSTPCVLVYDYAFDRSAVSGNVTVSNSATLEGVRTGSSDKKDIVLRESTSSATVESHKINIYKVDADNYTTVLPGAVFDLYEFAETSTNSNIWDWKKLETLTTDANGMITLDPLTDTNIGSNRLYRIIETQAPAGYQLDATPYVFLWMDKGASVSTTTATVSLYVTQELAKWQGRYIPYAGGSILVPNTYTSVRVEKHWLDQAGNATAAPSLPNGLEVKLYRQPYKANGYSVTVSVDGRSERTKKVTVAQNSPLTVTMEGWSITGDFTYNGTAYKITTSNGTGSVTIPAITSDTTINIVSSSQWNVNGLSLNGYDSPSGKTASGSRELVGTANLTAAGGWSHIWESLPTADSSGNTYYYTVEETVPSGCTAAYRNNDGICSGTIQILNTMSGYSLPATGGTGTAGMRQWGTACLLLGMLGLCIRKTTLYAAERRTRKDNTQRKQA